MATTFGTQLAPVATPSLSILLVEDNDLVAYSLAAILRRKGHDVQVAGSGEAALEAARACRPDVALVDIGLPGIDGYEVARRLHGPDVLLVALSGRTDDDSRREAADAGFATQLEKPVAFDELDRVL